MNSAYSAARRALYGGRTEEEIKEYKRLPAKEKLDDRMSMNEKAANYFCLTQIEELLKRGADAKQAAEVGAKVRQTIGELGGTMPEDMPLRDERNKHNERRTRKRGKTPYLPE